MYYDSYISQNNKDYMPPSLESRHGGYNRIQIYLEQTTPSYLFNLEIPFLVVSLFSLNLIQPTVGSYTLVYTGHFWCELYNVNL